MNEDPKLSNAFFGGGCFWCIEAAFSDLKGVSKVENGYSGGSEANANYKSVSAGITNHAEICKITYDPKKISYETLVKIFFSYLFYYKLCNFWIPFSSGTKTR